MDDRIPVFVYAGDPISQAGIARQAPGRPQLPGGEGTVPSDLPGRFLAQVGRLQRQVRAPRGLTFSVLSDREVDVLKLLADGFDTSQVAEELCYWGRTVKNVLHDIPRRHNLRN